jgi:hypothetical protein
MRTFAIEFGRCGWGAQGGLVPELRIGWVRVWTCSGSVMAILWSMREATAAALVELGRQQ